MAPVSSVGAVTKPVGLQSVFISNTRRAAIIDGQTVELGGRVGESKLVEVNEGYVVIEGTQGRQVMKLYPDIKLTPAKIAVKHEARPDSRLKSKHLAPKGKKPLPMENQSTSRDK
jgi:hypothetical protein